MEDMTRWPITNLRGVHHGCDIWVVGSGPSMDYIDQEFFRNKLVIGINHMYRYVIFCDYIVAKEIDHLPNYSSAKLIMSWGICGSSIENKKPYRGYYFEHPLNHREKVLFPTDPDKIIVSWSTVTSAMHIAAYMGAANIILCGCDCGAIDGKSNTHDYPGDIKLYRKFGPQNIQVRKWLYKTYGCNIYSLNPFINLGMEGHQYE